MICMASLGGKAQKMRSAHAQLRMPRPAHLQRSAQRRVARHAVDSTKTLVSAGSTPDAGGSVGPSGAPTGAPSTLMPAEPGARYAVFSASKTGSQDIVEVGRSLADYMALPASQYSLLDARRTERIDDNTFKCYVGRLNFPGLSVEPVLTLTVTTQERGCTIQLLSAQLQGSRIVESLNNQFSASMSNAVTWQETSSSSTKQIVSKTTLRVQVKVPGWAAMLPTSSVSSMGSSVMQATLNTMVPRQVTRMPCTFNTHSACPRSHTTRVDAVCCKTSLLACTCTPAS